MLRPAVLPPRCCLNVPCQFDPQRQDTMAAAGASPGSALAATKLREAAAALAEAEGFLRALGLPLEPQADPHDLFNDCWALCVSLCRRLLRAAAAAWPCESQAALPRPSQTWTPALLMPLRPTTSSPVQGPCGRRGAGDAPRRAAARGAAGAPGARQPPLPGGRRGLHGIQLGGCTLVHASRL